MQESKLMSKEEKKELKKQEKLKKIEEKKYNKEGVPEHLNYPKGTMVGFFLEAVARFPEDIAIEYYGRTYTYRTFYEMIRDTAKSLKQQEVKEAHQKVEVLKKLKERQEKEFYKSNLEKVPNFMAKLLKIKKEY